MADNYSATTLADSLKYVYSGKTKEDLIYRNSRLFKEIKKVTTEIGQKGLYSPVLFDYAPTGSADVAVASDLATQGAGPSIKAFLLTVVQDHSQKGIDHMTRIATRDDAKSYFDAAKLAAEQAMTEMTNHIGFSLYRNGWGALGVAASTDATKTVTLTNAADLQFFRINMKVQASSAESTAVLRAGVLTVASKNTLTNSVTFVETLASVGVVAGDYLFRKGDRQDSASPARRCIWGLDFWGPSAKLGAGVDASGVDRSVDDNLQFTITDGTVNSVEASIMQSISDLKKKGFMDAGRRMIICGENTLRNLQVEGLAQRQFIDPKDISLGTGKLFMQTPAGAMEIVGDPYCQDNAIWILDLDTLVLHSMGDPVDLFVTGSLEEFAATTSLSTIIKYYGYSNLLCNAPGRNSRINLS